MGQIVIFCLIEFFLILFASKMAADEHWAAVVSSSLIAIILAILEGALLIVRTIKENW